MDKLFRGQWPLVGILLLALALRCFGLQWGLPNALHVETYHPDELIVVQHSVAMNSLNGQLLPGFYRYGSLQLYLINFACTIAYLFSAVDLAHLQQGYVTSNWDKLYLIARSLTVIMGTATVWVTAAIGARLWNKRVGLIAALLLAVAPLHVLQSHWATVDVPATLWGMLAILAALWSLQPRSRIKGCILSGIFTGLSAATKYNMLLFILPMFAVMVISAWKGPDFFKSQDSEAANDSEPSSRISWTAALTAVAAGSIASGLAFLAACPGFILEHATFVSDFSAEALHVSRQPGETFEQTGNGFVYEWVHTLNAGLGLPLLLFVIAGIVWAVWRRDRASLILAAVVLPYSILIGLAAVRYARYAIPLIPMLSLWAGFVVYSAISRISGGIITDQLPAGKREKAAGATFSGLALLAFALTTGYTWWLVIPMSEPDPRDRAVQWLNGHTAPSTEIAFPTMPWFQTAPVCPYFPSHRGEWQMNPNLRAQYAMVLYTKDWDLDLLSQASPGDVVVSEYDTMDALRIGNPSAIAYMNAVKAQYSVGFQAGGYVPPPGLFMQHLPHDMIYANPQITIYVRR